MQAAKRRRTCSCTEEWGKQEGREKNRKLVDRSIPSEQGPAKRDGRMLTTRKSYGEKKEGKYWRADIGVAQSAGEGSLSSYPKAYEKRGGEGRRHLERREPGVVET